MIYSLHAVDKEGTFLHPAQTCYTEKCAQALCDFYLKDELVKDEKGNLRKFYRLYAKHDHSPKQAFVYDITCPNCRGGKLKQVGRQLSYNKLGLYACPVCSKK